MFENMRMTPNSTTMDIHVRRRPIIKLKSFPGLYTELRHDVEYEYQGIYISVSPPIPISEQVNRRLNAELVFLWVSPDSREAHYLHPQYSSETAEFKPHSYSFVALRLVEYSAGPVLVGWCSNPSCPDHLDRLGLACRFQGGADFPDRAAEDDLAGIKRLCSCSERVVGCGVTGQVKGQATEEQHLHRVWRKSGHKRVRPNPRKPVSCSWIQIQPALLG